MSSDIISAVAGGVVLILGSFFGFTKWMITKFLSELKPNGGSSLKDQINRLESRVDDIFHILGNSDNK